MHTRTALVALALGVAFATPGCAAEAPHPQNPVSLCVMSYNIRHAEGGDGRLDVDRIATVINAARPDIVALQEVDRGAERTARRDLPAELARLTGLEFYFGRSIPLQGGEYGNAVLTRFPIKRASTTPLTTLGDGEPRTVVQLILDVHGRDLLFLNTHLDHRDSDAERVISVDEIAQILGAAKTLPVIACGDFNALPASRVHTKMKTLLTDAWEVVGRGTGYTIPAEAPTERIDFIWISSATFTPETMEVPSSLASDHLPVVGKFTLR